MAAPDWPAHGRETRPWPPTVRGPRADRMVTEVEVSMPPMIATLDLVVSGEVLAAVESAIVAITSLDARHGDRLATFGTFLVRTEAVASSALPAEPGLGGHRRARGDRGPRRTVARPQGTPGRPGRAEPAVTPGQPTSADAE